MKPAPGEACVPSIDPKFSPLPGKLIINVFACDENAANPLLSRSAAPAPTNGEVVAPSYVGAYVAPLVEVSVYPLPLTSL